MPTDSKDLIPFLSKLLINSFSISSMPSIVSLNSSDLNLGLSLNKPKALSKLSARFKISLAKEEELYLIKSSLSFS